MRCYMCQGQELPSIDTESLAPETLRGLVCVRVGTYGNLECWICSTCARAISAAWARQYAQIVECCDPPEPTTPLQPRVS